MNSDVVRPHLTSPSTSFLFWHFPVWKPELITLFITFTPSLNLHSCHPGKFVIGNLTKFHWGRQMTTFKPFTPFTKRSLDAKFPVLCAFIGKTRQMEMRLGCSCRFMFRPPLLIYVRVWFMFGKQSHLSNSGYKLTNVVDSKFCSISNGFLLMSYWDTNYHWKCLLLLINVYILIFRNYIFILKEHFILL